MYPFGPVEAESDGESGSRTKELGRFAFGPISSEGEHDDREEHEEDKPGTITVSISHHALLKAQVAMGSSIVVQSSVPPARVYDGRARAYNAGLKKRKVEGHRVHSCLADIVQRPECACSCRSCFLPFREPELFSTLEAFVQDFWNLDHKHQNLLFFVAAGGVSEQKSKRSVRHWELLGIKVSPRCLCSLLGIHRRRLYKAIACVPDGRCGPRPREHIKGADVDAFFCQVYFDHGETLPDRFVCRGARLHGKAFRNQLGEADSSDSSDGDPLSEKHKLADLDKELKGWLLHTVEAGRTMDMIRSLGGADITGLPKRKLPPGNLSGLYANYLLQRGQAQEVAQKCRRSKKSEQSSASWQDVSSESEPEMGQQGDVVPELPSAASWSVFYKRWQEKWHLVFEFHHESAHSACDECCRYKQLMKGWLTQLQSDVASAVLENMTGYQRHLSAVAADRSFINGLRVAVSSCPDVAGASGSSERSMRPSDYLLVIIDGMDQAKWRLPRFPELRIPKSAAHLQRPTVVVEAVWVVGHRLDFYLLDKDQHHDSNSIQECLAVSLERVAEFYRSQKSLDSMPRTIILVADNTVREAKNQYLFKYWAIHVAKNRFDICLQLHMRAGHTHDVLGQSLKDSDYVSWCP